MGIIDAIDDSSSVIGSSSLTTSLGGGTATLVEVGLPVPAAIGGAVIAISSTATSVTGPDAVIEVGGEVFNVFTENSKPYHKVENRAEQIYNKFSQEEKINSEATMYIETKESADVIEEIVNSISRQKLINELEALREYIQQENPEEKSIKYVK